MIRNERERQKKWNNPMKEWQILNGYFFNGVSQSDCKVTNSFNICLEFFGSKTSTLQKSILNTRDT